MKEIWHRFITYFTQRRSSASENLAQDKRNSGEERNQEMWGALLEELLSSFTCIDEFSEPRYKPLPGDDDLKESHSICKEWITTYLNRMNTICLRCKTKGKVPRKPSSNSTISHGLYFQFHIQKEVHISSQFSIKIFLFRRSKLFQWH